MSCRQATRETVVDVDRAWEVISDPAELERWLAEEVDLEPVEGSDASFTVDGVERRGRVESVEEGHGLSFVWGRELGRPSLVELELTECVGGVRIAVTETDLGAGPTMGVALGWEPRLERLAGLLALVLA